MKKLRKMVSVILCVVISCMCMVTPVCAIEKAEPAYAGTNVPNIGIQRICMYPAVLDGNGNLTAYNYPTISKTYVSGTDMLHMTVSASTLAAFSQYNCNVWYFEIYFCSDSNVNSIDFRINGNVLGTTYDKQSSKAALVLRNMDYFTYSVVYHLKSGATPAPGGHVNVR